MTVAALGSARTTPTAPPDLLVLERQDDGDEVMLALAGELELGAINRMTSALRACLRPGVHRIVVDLRQLRVISAEGVDALAAFDDDARAVGARTTVVTGAVAAHAIAGATHRFHVIGERVRS